MDSKIILYLDGGAMSGIFGGGVISRMEELDIYDKIEAIYAGSAGVFNAAYFLARQTKQGFSVYYDYLIQGFINRSNFFPGLAQRFCHKLIKRPRKEKILNVIDIDYVADVIKNKVPLDFKKLRQQPIPLFVKMLNIRTGKSEYFSIKGNDSFELLRGCACMAPYTFDSVQIGDDYYIDGTIETPIGLGAIINRHPDRKIVVITNSRLASGYRHQIKNFLEGLVAGVMYDKRIFKLFTNRERSIKQDMKIIRTSPNVFLIHAPKSTPVRPRTRDRKILKQSYEMGKIEGDKILSILDL